MGELKHAAPGRRDGGQDGGQDEGLDGGREGWRRPWLPWAVGLGLLLVGAFVGWASSYLTLSPHLGAPAGTPRSAGKLAPAVDGARVAAIVPSASLTEAASLTPAVAAPGEQVILSWQVWNTGGVSWAADSYRFAPADDRNGVIPLPHAVPPGESVTVRAAVTVPDVSDVWQPTWQLTGPKGPVPGGALTAHFTPGPGQENPAPSGKR